MSRRSFLQMSAATVAASTLLSRAADSPAGNTPQQAPDSKEKPAAPPGAPNIVFIITDQQRSDTVAALGCPWMITPNLDRLVREGVAFTRAYCAAPSCVASRHALMTGYYAPTTGVFGFDSWSGRNDWLQEFGKAGYHMASLGKVHYQPVRDLPAYWDERVVVENKSEGEMPSIHGGKTLDDWGLAIAKKNIPKPVRRDEKYPDFDKRLGAFAWEYDESDQADIWAGDRAVQWIDNYHGTAPFFLWVGFPGPHEPYDPPKRFLDMYEGRQMPPASGSYADLTDPAKQVPWETKAYADFIENGSGDHKLALSKATPETIAETRRHYAANVTAIDEKVGDILDALERRGLLDNTIVVFTSDHGDTLFDHGVPYKWTPYEGSVHVPLIVRYPKAFARGLRTDRMTSLLDVVPPLFEQASLPVPPNRQWRSASAALANVPEKDPPRYAYCVHGGDQFNPSTWIMVASDKWKYVHYINSESRQLYDLENDPGELRNLAFDPDHAPLRAAMESEALRWFASNTRQGAQVWSASMR